MVPEPEAIDISNNPELVALAREVCTTGIPRVLRANGEELGVLAPPKPRRRRRPRGKGLTREDSLWRIIGIASNESATDVSENVDKYLADAYLDTHEHE